MINAAIPRRGSIPPVGVEVGVGLIVMEVITGDKVVGIEVGKEVTVGGD